MNTLMKWTGGVLMFVATQFFAVPHVLADDDDVFEITIKDTSFMLEGNKISDQIVVLPAGIKVSWMNVDPLITASGLEGIMPHGVMIKNPDGSVVEKSPLLFQGTTTFSYRFDKPGSYTYLCFVHPSLMKGQFLVFSAEVASLEGEQLAAQ